MRKSLAMLSSFAIGLVALSAVPTPSEAHWWWYRGDGSGSGSGSGTSTSPPNTRSTAPGFSRTYVSPDGLDTNGCSINDPCRTFQAAHDRTFINGEVNCTESGGYGPVIISKSITIDCKEVPASINLGTTASPNNGNAVWINIPANAANDPLRVVRLRGFTISGSGGQSASNATTVTGSGTRIATRGILISSASAVYIEHLVVSDINGLGIADARSVGPTKLFILDTVVRNNSGTGIGICSVSNATAVLDNVRSEGNNFGIGICPSNLTAINRSVFSGNTVAGVQLDAAASAHVSNSVSSHNGAGLLTNGPGARLSNNDLAFNTTGASGVWVSYGNNRLSGNTSVGTPPTSAGAPSTDNGQQ